MGLWIEQTEGAKFWLKVMNELKARGVNDILIAVADGLKGFPEAITIVYPQTLVKTCIVGSLKKVSRGELMRRPRPGIAGPGYFSRQIASERLSRPSRLS